MTEEIEFEDTSATRVIYHFFDIEKRELVDEKKNKFSDEEWSDFGREVFETMKAEGMDIPTR